MEMLNSSSLMLKSDLWQTIIGWFGSWIQNYGWAIIVFTIALKLILLPLDIFQRVSSQKQSRFMRVMQPEMQALQVKYANDKDRLNQETSKLYKKYNMNMGGMCLSMLLPLIFSLVIFFTLFGSLRSYGNEKLYTTYQQMDSAVVQELGERSLDEISDKSNLVIVVKDEYANVKKQNGWLWVKNVWKSDTAVSQFVDFDDYASYKNLSGEAKDLAKDRYDFIVSTIDGEKQSNNGCFVLIILAAAVSFLTQFISAKLMTPKGQKMNTMNKVMFAVMPISMIIFASTSNAVFGLYIITNSVMSTLISTTLTLIMNHRDKGKTDAELIQTKKVEVVEYSRNYKK